MKKNEVSDVKRFCAKAALFLLPVFIVLGGLEYLLSRVHNNYDTKRRLLESQLNDIEVYVLGNSHIHYGVNPRFFKEKGFNLSHVAQSLVADSQLVMKYVDQTPKLKVVVLSISYFSMEYMVNGSIDRWRNYFYQRFSGVEGDGTLADRTSLKNFSLIALYERKVVFDAIKSRFKLNLAQALDNDGSFTNVSHIPKSDQTGKSRLEFIHTLMSPTRLAANEATLNQLIEQLQKRGIKVALITSPVFKTYRDHIDAKAYERMQEAIGRVKQAWHVPYFNYFADARFAEGDFEDDDHLCTHGSRKFSEILDREVIGPLVTHK